MSSYIGCGEGIFLPSAFPAPYQITHYHDYRPGWAIYCESLNSEYQWICQDQISLYMFTNKYLIE